MYVPKRFKQYWMSGIFLRVETIYNQVALEPALGELDPYDAAIASLINLLNTIMHKCGLIGPL